MDMYPLLNLNRQPFPDFGQTFYVVDSDYRTAAQGWSRPDRTGPLDLYEARRSGPGGVSYVHRTGDYTSDASALQAAINGAVDFRGDAVLLTPGSYSVATALTLDAAGMRLMGTPRDGRQGKVGTTVTAAVDAALTVSVDDVELAYFTAIPLTAANMVDIASGADRGYIHDIFYNAAGIAASTSTEFVNGTTCIDWTVRNCSFYVDAAQGDAFTLTSAERWVWDACDFTVGITAIAWASVFTFTTSMLGSIARRCFFTTAGGATPAVFTNAFTGVANVNGQIMITDCRLNGTAFSAGTAIEATFGTTTDIELAENYFSGDATTEGGVLVVLA